MNLRSKPASTQEIWEHRFRSQVRTALTDRLGGAYKSKAYRAYIRRCVKHYAPTPVRSGDSMSALGAALATDLLDRMDRPGFMSRILRDPAAVEYDRKMAEVKEQVTTLMQSVLPYSRHINYQSKEPK